MRQQPKGRAFALALDTWWATKQPELRTVFPAFVLSYDHAAKKATVQPSIRLRYSDGRPNEAHAPLSQRPVVQVARGAGWVITHELAAGDQVLCLASDRALDAWEGSDGQLVDPRMRRWHAAMDAVVLGGLAPAGAQTPVADPGELYVGREDGQVAIRLGIDGTARIVAGPKGAGATIEVKPDGAVVVTPAPGKRVELGGAGPNPNVARVGDAVKPTGTGVPGLDMKTWINAVSTALNTIAPGTINPGLLAAVLLKIGEIDTNTCPVGASDA